MRWLVLVGVIVGCGARTELGVGRAADAGAPEDAGRDVGVPVDAAEEVPVLPACASHQVKIADADGAPDQIVVDGAFVYWHDQLGVRRAPKTGGPAQTVAPVPPFGWPTLADFALSSADVYFVGGPGLIVMTSLQGGGPVQPFPIPVPTFPVVATSSVAVYAWSQGGPGPLFSMPLGGGPPSLLTTLPMSASKMVIDGTHGFAAGDAGILSVDLTSGSVVTMVPGGASDIAIDAIDAYFTTLPVTAGTQILRVPKGGGPLGFVLARTGAYALALSSTDLYFTERLDGVVYKMVGKTTGPLQPIATLAPTTQPVGIALDDQCVYFTAAPNGAPGAIYAVPK